MRQLLEGINSLKAEISRIFNLNSNNKIECHFHGTVNFISEKKLNSPKQTKLFHKLS